MTGFKKNYLVFMLSLFFSLMIPFAFLRGDADIAGKVTLSPTLEGLKNIKITLEGDFSQETLTDDSGFFQFSSVPSGRYLVQMELPSGYVAAGKNPIIAFVESSILNVKFPIGIPASITGQVTSKDTHCPIEGAKIEIMRGPRVCATTTTDQNGMYALSDLVPWNCGLRVTALNMSQAFQILSLKSGAALRWNLKLEALPGKIVGQVTDDATKEPIGGAAIQIYKNGILIDCTQSDQTGMYAFEEVFPNVYELKAAANNYLTAGQYVESRSQESIAADFTLKISGRVDGTVVHAFTREPIGGACVGLWQNDALFSETKTDEHGNFSITGDGSCQLVVQAFHFYDLETLVKISPGETSRVNFDLVCLEPFPVSRARVKVIHKQVRRHTNRIYCIEWRASRDTRGIAFYRLYRGGKCIAEIPSTEPLNYCDEWRGKKKKIYQITAVNAYGQESKPFSVEAE